jgi:hypothetical protein
MRFQAIAVLASVVAAYEPAAGQHIRMESVGKGRPIFGATVGMAGVPSAGGITMVGLQVATLADNNTGVEIAAYTAPSALEDGAFAIAPAVSAIGVLQSGDLWYTLKGGATMPLVFGGDVGGGFILFHGGAGAIFPASEAVGIRAELQALVAPIGNFAPAFAFTVGLTSRPK